MEVSTLVTPHMEFVDVIGDDVLLNKGMDTVNDEISVVIENLTDIIDVASMDETCFVTPLQLKS